MTDHIEPNTPSPQTPVLVEAVGVTTPWKKCNISLDRPVRDKLRVLKRQTNFKSFNSLINYMVEINRNALPIASFELIFKDARPIVLVGETGSGKTYFVQHEIMGREIGGSGIDSHLPGFSNCFLIDSANEYEGVERIDFGDIFSLKWEAAHDRRIRFVPDSNSMLANAQVQNIFLYLNTLKNQGSLKSWTIIVEEGHRYADDRNLHNLLMEARKSTRKLIVVATDPTGFQGTPTLKPKPWQA
jgi:hypothetical protein